MLAGHFFSEFQNFYFFSLFLGAGVVAFLSDEQQAFLSEEQQAFLSFSLHVVVVAFLFSSLVAAFTVEAANPIVKATAKTIANFFMILYLLVNTRFFCQTKNIFCNCKIH